MPCDLSHDIYIILYPCAKTPPMDLVIEEEENEQCRERKRKDERTKVSTDTGS